MIENEIIVSKITRPHPPASYFRTDLCNLLDELVSKRLIVVSGPPGTGKSNLVASYIESRNLPDIWCRVDKGDNDPTTFFNYLSVALRDAKAGSNAALPYLTEDVLRNISAFSKKYFQEFCRHLKPPFLIVLDNYQEIEDDSCLHEAILAGCNELPHGGRIIIITTKECPHTLTRLRSNNMLAIIEWDDLK
jgi:ATP/maltotriose-dependent transcriptional regulator MalT